MSSILGSIGNTPLVRLRSEQGAAEVWAKFEAANPGGSIKDRIALSMIEAAVNLTGLATSDLARGDVVCRPDAYRATRLDPVASLSRR